MATSTSALPVRAGTGAARGHERESGIFLSVLGVGTGNLKDSTMELADKGNGNYFLSGLAARGAKGAGAQKWAERWRRLPRT